MKKFQPYPPGGPARNLGSRHILSAGGEVPEEVGSPNPPQLVTEWVQSETGKSAAPQYYHFWGPPLPRIHLFLGPRKRWDQGKGGGEEEVGPKIGCPSALPLSGGRWILFDSIFFTRLSELAGQVPDPTSSTTPPPAERMCWQPCHHTYNSTFVMAESRLAS